MEDLGSLRVDKPATQRLLISVGQGRPRSGGHRAAVPCRQRQGIQSARAGSPRTSDGHRDRQRSGIEPRGPAPVSERLHLNARAVLYQRRLGGKRLKETIPEHPELQGVEDFMHSLGRRGAADEFIEIDVEGHVAHQLGEMTIDQHLR